jgi:carotenoid cleavage dioxygenase
MADQSTDPATDVPLHLAGNHAPVVEEVTVCDLDVVGTVPPELDGLVVRNGPNPRSGWSAHLFDGDGMVHGVRLRDGRALAYRNRYVRTPLYEHPGASRMELAYDRTTGRIDHRVSTANTHIVAHAGRLLALEEGGFPYELTGDLTTVGPFTFAGALRGAMTAHPERCPDSGDLLFFGYQLGPPYVTLYRATADGRVVDVQPVELPGPTMMHDFAVTSTRIVLVDSPIDFDPRAIASGGSPWLWNDDKPARIGVIDRPGRGERTAPTWFEIEPGHLSHAWNAWDDDDSVVLTGTRVGRDPAAMPGGFGTGLPFAHRWRLDPRAGWVRESALDDVATEYPRVADAVIGRRHRFGYSVSFALDAAPDHGEVYCYDVERGEARRTHRWPRGQTSGEAVFVPSADDAGYLLTFVHDRATDRSRLAILDAGEIEAAPIAEVHLPVRVPNGFHGSWVPASAQAQADDVNDVVALPDEYP